MSSELEEEVPTDKIATAPLLREAESVREALERDFSAVQKQVETQASQPARAVKACRVHSQAIRIIRVRPTHSVLPWGALCCHGVQMVSLQAQVQLARQQSEQADRAVLQDSNDDDSPLARAELRNSAAFLTTSRTERESRMVNLVPGQVPTPPQLDKLSAGQHSRDQSYTGVCGDLIAGQPTRSAGAQACYLFPPSDGPDRFYEGAVWAGTSFGRVSTACHPVGAA